MAIQPPKATSRKTGVYNAAESYNWDLFMMRLYYKEGISKKSTKRVFGNKPILLNQPDTFWLVYSGSVDVFSADYRDGQVASARSHVLHIEGGQAFFGMPDHPGRVLLATSSVETELVTLPRTLLETLIADPDFVQPASILIDIWLRNLSAAVFPRLTPKDYMPLDNLPEVELASGAIVRNRQALTWITVLNGMVKLNGHPDFALAPGDMSLPLSEQAWMEASEASKITALSTEQLFNDGRLWDSLYYFHLLILDYEAHVSAIALEQERQRLQRRAAADSVVVESAFQQLSAILEPKASAGLDGDSGDPLFAACRLVGNAMGIDVQMPATVSSHTYVYPMQSIAIASHFRVRQVALKGTWWRHDNGPLVGSVTENDNIRYVALLPDSPTSYKVHDPVKQTIVKVTPEVAASLDGFGYVFYRPLPARVLKAVDLIRFSLRGYSSDLVTIALVGALVGAVGVILPLVTGQIFDTILPSAERATLIGIGLVLFVSAISTALFSITRNIALLRMEGKMGLALQAATMDRVLDLPPTFFRQFSTGDLGMRVMSIDAIRQAISGSVVQALLSSVFSIFSFAILFAFDVRLGFVATGLLLLLAVVIAVTSLVQLRYERRLRNIEGTLSSIVLQFIYGISKFRVSGSERRAFAYWAKHFSVQRKLRFQSKMTGNVLATFNEIFPLLTLVAIFSTVIFSDNSQLSTGQFLAFTAAFTQVSMAVLQLSSVFSTLIGVLPIYERAQPILKTVPEVSDLKTDPGELHGEIEISHVSFRYTAEGPLVLDNISIHVQPGQFIALVGPSGSGKSTIMRLLLGFETPESGTVLYDGQDLSELDVRAVRRQIGVVLQNGKLMVGDIYRNIVGASTLTLDDAWNAARMVSLDEDLKHMPMGMNTVVSEGGGTLSGGQRQRLMIARAIVNKPRILFFDEATSALDNQTQAAVSKCLENLDATQIVIAHRLSTIVNADCIYVMEHGKIVQTGSYAELIKQKGLFADLARRQLA